MKPNQYTDEEMLEALRFVDNLKECYLSKRVYKDTRKKYPELPPCNAITNRFGGWMNSKKAAGIKDNNKASPTRTFCNDCTNGIKDNNKASPTRTFCNDCTKEKCTIDLEDCELFHEADLYFQEVG